MQLVLLRGGGEYLVDHGQHWKLQLMAGTGMQPYHSIRSFAKKAQSAIVLKALLVLSLLLNCGWQWQVGSCASHVSYITAPPPRIDTRLPRPFHPVSWKTIHRTLPVRLLVVLTLKFPNATGDGAGSFIGQRQCLGTPYEVETAAYYYNNIDDMITGTTAAVK